MLEVVVIKLKLGTIRPKFYEINRQKLPLKVGYVYIKNMPTILYIYGWRLFFYSNEKNEPIHIHVQKANMEGKFWLKIDEISIEEAFCYNFTPAAKREIKKIIYQHFDLIVDAWFKHFINPDNGKVE